MFLSTWHELETSVKEEPQLRIFFHLSSLWSSLWGIFLIVNWYRQAKPTVDSAILVCIKEGSRSLRMRKAFLHGFYFRSCFQVHTWVLLTVDCYYLSDVMNHFPGPCCFLDVLFYFITATESQLEQIYIFELICFPWEAIFGLMSFSWLIIYIFDIWVIL